MKRFSTLNYSLVAGIIAALLVMGHVLLFSATAILGIEKFGSEFYFVSRQAVCAIAGLALMVGLSFFPHQKLKNWALFLLATELVLVAATLFSPLGIHVSGASRWLQLGQLRFQPSELGKPVMVIYMAALLSRHMENRLSPRSWVLHLLPVIALLLLIYRQPDLGTTVILVMVIFSLLFIAKIHTGIMISLLCAGGGLFFFALARSAYRARRISAFLNPWADPQGAGFQSIQSFLSLHSGKITGAGIGNGNSKFFFLPEVHTDFIFSLIGQELGFIGALFILAMFVWLLYLLFKTAASCREPFGCLVAYGLTLILALQILVNLGGVTGLLPVKGLPLPFISWGRSALIVNLISIGILLNILRQSTIMTPNDKKIRS